MKAAQFSFFLAFLVLNCFSFSIQVQAQTINEHSNKGTQTADYDARVLMHYSVDELNDLKNVAPDKFNTILYYYTSSYLIESVPCSDCSGSFNQNTFDISVFEKMRQKNQRVEVFQEKYGYKVILLSGDELTYRTPYQEFLMGY